MAIKSISSLNFFAASDKQLVFNVTEYGDGAPNRTYFGEVGKIDSMDDRINYNTGCVYDLSNNIVIRGLFDIRRTQVKSAIKKNQSLDSADNLIDIYAPTLTSDIIGFAQIDSYSYLLNSPTTQSPMTFGMVQTNSKLNDDSYYCQLSSTNLPTYLYKALNEYPDNYASYGDVAAMTYANNSGLSAIFDVKTNLSGVQYNYVYELPLDLKYSYYDDGVILGDVFVGKNAYDSTYNMNAISASGKLQLANARKYAGIEYCSNSIFLKYYDNVKYMETGTRIDTGVSNLNGDPIIEVPIAQSMIRSTDGPYCQYQHVETINNINRFSTNLAHKSSLYSLELVDTGLNDNADIVESVKAKLRQDVKNNIRTIAEKICPATTQLFEIYFSGK